MVAHSRIRWVVLALLCGCGEPETPDAGARPADVGPGDAAPVDMGPDAELFEVEPVTCPPPGDDGLPRVDVQPPGSWRLEGCEGRAGLRFMVPPGAAWHLEAASSADEPPIVPRPAGDNPLDAPEEVVSSVFFDREHPPVVTIRWVECAESERCGADRYCARDTYTCVACADGDELFDTRQDPAPRTGDRPRAFVDGRAAGEVCAGFDDWYEIRQPAGQPLVLIEQARAYVADPTAATLADLAPVPLVAPTTFGGLDVEPVARMVPPAEVERTLWVRLSTDEPRWRYGFAVDGCDNSGMCLPWWYCDRDGGDVCRACEGERDAHGDDDLRRSPDGAPIPLAPGRPRDGAICGIDEDWYAVTLGDPASRIEIAGAIGFAFAADVDPSPEALEEFWLEAGDRIVLRGDMPEWYPGSQAPEVVLIQIVRPEELDDFRGTFAYSIRVEDGDFCAPDRFGCPAGRVCEADSGQCMPGR